MDAPITATPFVSFKIAVNNTYLMNRYGLHCVNWSFIFHEIVSVLLKQGAKWAFLDRV